MGLVKLCALPSKVSYFIMCIIMFCKVGLQYAVLHTYWYSLLAFSRLQDAKMTVLHCLSELILRDKTITTAPLC